MVFSLLSRKSSVPPQSPPLTASSSLTPGKLRRRSDESGVDLAQAYRHGPPPRMLVNAFKHQVGWRLLDQQARLSVQEVLLSLVERVGGDATSFDFQRAVQADFAVEPETLVAANQRRADLLRLPDLAARLPQLEDELRDVRRQLTGTQERLHKSRGECESLRDAYERTVNDHEAERTCSRVLANRLSADVQELATRLLAPMPVQVRHKKNHRRSMPPVLPAELQGAPLLGAPALAPTPGPSTSGNTGAATAGSPDGRLEAAAQA